MYVQYVCLCMGLCAAYDMYVNITDLRNCVSLKFKLLYGCMYVLHVYMYVCIYDCEGNVTTL